MGDPRNTRKYPEISEIPESKKDTRKYPFVYFDTPTRPEPNPLPIFFPIPDPILKNPTRWALDVTKLVICEPSEQGIANPKFPSPDYNVKSSIFDV